MRTDIVTRYRQLCFDEGSGDPVCNPLILDEVRIDYPMSDSLIDGRTDRQKTLSLPDVPQLPGITHHTFCIHNSNIQNPSRTALHHWRFFKRRPRGRSQSIKVINVADSHEKCISWSAQCASYASRTAMLIQDQSWSVLMDLQSIIKRIIHFWNNLRNQDWSNLCKSTRTGYSN